MNDTDRVLFPWVEGEVLPNDDPALMPTFMTARCPGCGIWTHLVNHEEQTHQCGNSTERGFGCKQRYNVRRKHG